MRPSTFIFASCLILAIANPIIAADIDPSGNWKLTFFTEDQQPTLWLIGLSREDGRWTGKAVTMGSATTPPTKIDDLTIKDGSIDFNIVIQDQRFEFNGRLSSKDPKTILGSLNFHGQTNPAKLTKTSITTLDRFDLAKEELSQNKTGPLAIVSAMTLVHDGPAKNATRGEMKKWAAMGWTAAEPFGRAMQRTYGMHVVDGFLGDRDLQSAAAEYADRARKLLTPSDPPLVRERVLAAALLALRSAGRKEEVRHIEEQLEAIQLVKIKKLAGRKGNRVALVELFTGAQCPPCVAADIAFDGLLKTFSARDAVFLQYHENIPEPDPLTSPSSEERLKYYGQDSTPTVLINGKPGPEGGGPIELGQETYDAYHAAVMPSLDDDVKAAIKVAAVREGEKIQITAQVNDLGESGEHIRLRLALVEPLVYYAGTNGIAVDHQVVRAFAGGARGLALGESDTKHSLTVDLAEIRKQLRAHQAKSITDNGAFPGAVRPADLTHLNVVAFVQNDNSKQVLQAMQVPVGEANGK